ncbi:MAG: bacteriohemerythrin [Melioribacteraceae bacterium]|nr:bacteriohemerythrin [Melioribacteraceae bacterium]
MAYIKWRDNYDIGFKEVDEQHKQLVSIINELYEAQSTGTSKIVIGESLDKVIDYTRYHFESEEKYMKDYNYPGLDQHKKEHIDLINQAENLKKEFTNNNLLLSLKTLDFLKDWLINHILGSDKEFGEYVRQQEIGT